MDRSDAPSLELLRIDPAVHRNFVRWNAVPTPRETTGFMEAFTGRSGFRPGFNALVDVRNVSVNAKALQLRNLATARAKATSLKQIGKRAFVVSDDMSFGVMRMYFVMHENTPGNYAVFRAFPDAMQWIDIPENYCLPF